MMNGKVTDDTNTTLTIPDNACVLAPMVRCGTLPLRLFALRRGADLVFTEELVDRPLAESVRLYNERAKTEDFCTKDVAVVLRTKPEEKPKLVLQLGTSNPSLAVQAVNKARHCISAVDINCGCPKHFSIQAGMGAALLRKPETLTELIKSIRTDCKLPVSCKIRLLDTKADTIHLMQQIEQAGASFISVHVRTVAERAKDPAHWDMLGELVKSVNVPVIANGDIWSAEDISSIRKFSGCRGVMLARGALFDPSIFTVHKTGDVRCYTSIEESVQEYLRIAAEVGNMHANTKFTVLSMLKECKSLNAEKGLAVQSAKCPRDLAAAFAIEEEICETLRNLDEDPSLGKMSKRQRKEQRKRIQESIGKYFGDDEVAAKHSNRSGNKHNRKRKHFDVKQALGIKSRHDQSSNINTSSMLDATLVQRHDDGYFLQFMSEESRKKVKTEESS